MKSGIGWLGVRMEMGSGALGSRSIPARLNLDVIASIVRPGRAARSSSSDAEAREGRRFVSALVHEIRDIDLLPVFAPTAIAANPDG